MKRFMKGCKRKLSTILVLPEFLFTWNEIMAKPEAVQIPTIETLSKAYVDPVIAQIIIEQLEDLKRKTALAEEQLLILQVKAT